MPLETQPTVDEAVAEFAGPLRGTVLRPENGGSDGANGQWARDGLAAVVQLPVAAGRYGNVPGFAEDPAELTDGDTYDRLVEVKTAFDPENRFHVHQGVTPHAGGGR